MIVRLRAMLSQQIQALFPSVPLVYGLVLAALIAAGLQTRVSIAILVRDPAQTAHYPFYVGLFSYVGILLWCAAAAISFFAAAVGQVRSMAAYLLCGGLLTTMLGLDDLLVLHEEVLPQLGISEKVVLAVYGIAALAYFLGFIKVVFRTNIVALGLALVCFAGSELFDQGFLNQGLNFLLDDGLKLLGIAGWASYFIRLSLHHVRQQIAH
jgi:hypothetical protein